MTLDLAALVTLADALNAALGAHRQNTEINFAAKFKTTDYPGPAIS